jgi:hypothetical protein
VIGWILETAIEWIWTDTIVAVYRRYGLLAATMAALGSLTLIGLFLVLLFSAR